MEISAGIDVVSISRVKKLYLRYGGRFLKRIFTEEELIICLKRKDPTPCLAGRFCAKEAFMKALGTGARKGVTFSQIGIVREKSGKPVLNLKGKAKKLLGKRKAEISITHGKDIAAAIAIIYGENRPQ